MSLHPIASINLKEHVLTLANPMDLGFYSWGYASYGDRYYFANMFEAMDEEGEFYFNRATSVLS
jgi:hypothetical protein